MREQARIVFIRTDHDMKLRRALLKRSRPERRSFAIGQWIMYWRNGRGALPGAWNGPARVVLTEDRNIVWITHQSRLFLCAPEHLRPLSDRESQAPEVSEQHGEIPKFPLPNQLGSGVFQYHDLTQQQITTSPTITESPNIPEAHNPIPNNADNSIESETNIPPNTNHTSSTDTNPDVQPDAEPAHIPTAPQTPDNNATTDNVHLPDEIPRGGLDVELPTTDEEGLGVVADVRDHWTLEGSQLIRHHSRPRKCLCCPVGLHDIPIPAEWLTDTRETHVETSQGLSWVHQDLWRKNILAHQSVPMTWTGKTVFTIKEESLPNCPSSQQYAALCHETPARGYEMALTLDADEILQCSRQSDSEQIAFLASSAKKQRSEVKEKDLSPSEKTLFQAAKTKEIVSWLSTETVRKITRSQIPEEQILRSRWVLT